MFLDLVLGRGWNRQSRFPRRRLSGRGMSLERLEDRHLLSVGDLLQTIANPSDGTQAGANFGHPVAVDGDLTVVGAYGADLDGFRDVGCAYVYNSTTGELVATLNNPTPGVEDQFGYSVAISGTTVVVGANGDDTGAVDAGSAYVFDAITGSLLRTLNNPTPGVGDSFGSSVAISGGTVVVGSPSESGVRVPLPDDGSGASGVGSAYVFDAATGALLWTLDNPTPADGDYFGISVAVSGSTVVVGDYGDDTGASNAGSAYVFDAATGNLLWTLNNPTPAADEAFGDSVAVSGNTVVVGAPDDHAGTARGGSAYVFDAASGGLLWTLDNPTPLDYDRFGDSVAVSGSAVVVASPADDTMGTDAGSAYVFDAATGSLLRTPNNPAAEPHDMFGSSVAVSGNTLVVGARWDDTGVWHAGSVHVFDAATGDDLRTLNNPTPGGGDSFGYSVAISGSTIVVGASNDSTGATQAGSVYVFDAATGNLLWTRNNPTPATYEHFGYSVAISGSTIVVGAPGAGSVYVFDRATGELLRTLNNPTPATSHGFGGSVAISGSTIVVGADGDDTGAEDAGAAYVFDASTGELLWTLNNPAPAKSDWFGNAVAISGSTVVVGAYCDDTGALAAGSAYVFDATTGDLLWTLNNPTPALLDEFGTSVAISGSTIVVGADGDDTGASSTGSAYVFDATTGHLLLTLNNPTPADGDRFGRSVAVWEDTVLVGAPTDSTVATHAGAVYMFDAATGDLLATLTNPAPDPSSLPGHSVPGGDLVVTDSLDSFGGSVAVFGRFTVVGARGEDAVTVDRGAAYVFEAPAVAPIDLGPTGFVTRTAQDLSAGDLWYSLTTGANNRLTVDATYDPAAGTCSLAWYDAQGNLLGSSEVGAGYERLDRAGVAPGETYFVQVSGANTDVDLRFCQLVDQQGTAVTVGGTLGPDQFQFGPGSDFQVTINGVEYQFSDAELDTIAFDGRAGSDSAVVTGTPGADTIRLGPKSASLTSASLGVTIANCPTIPILGNGGDDTAKMNDSTLDDTLTAAPQTATLAGPGFTSTVEQVPNIYVYARNGGHDVACIDGGAGKDTAKFQPDIAWMYARAYYTRAKFFDEVYADGKGGADDTAIFCDSPGKDVLVADAHAATVTTGARVRKAVAFELVTVYGSATDTAALGDSPGNDIFDGLMHKSRIYSTGTYQIVARGFKNVTATASAGFDKARLYDTPEDDAYECWPGRSKLTGGGTTGLAIEVQGFDKVTLVPTLGGDDRADLYDTPDNDYLEASGDRARLYRNAAVLELLYETRSVERVTAHGSMGTNTRSVSEPLGFDLIFAGNWEP